MYRFSSFESFENEFDSAYAKALEDNYPFTDFDRIALWCMRMNISHVKGELEGIMSTAVTEESRLLALSRINQLKVELEACIEAATKKMEELGLL